MIIAGIDEAGRGCWAGPLVAAAVVLSSPIAGLNDSKTLSRLKRETLAMAIRKSASVGIGIVSAEEIDALGLTAATSKAMAQATGQVTAEYNHIIIDGNYNYLAGSFLDEAVGIEAIIKADATVPEVSAASIIAKVTRDAYMRTIDANYALYGFSKHVGYGTALHQKMLTLHGPCREHRKTYKPVQKASL